MLRWSWPVLAVVFALAAIARAEPVGPGQIVQIFDRTTNVSGDLLAHDSRQFTLSFTKETTLNLDYRLDSDVFRETSSGHLTFRYAVTGLSPSNAPELRGFSERSDTFVRSFSGFDTMISGFAGAGTSTSPGSTAERSADGSEIRFSTLSHGQGLVPTLVVRTNALNFDSLGSITFIGGDEFGVGPAGGVVAVDASANLSGTFQPASAATAVPLPPGVWAGLITLVLAGAYLRKHHPRLA
jgi:hypothetical protein